MVRAKEERGGEVESERVRFEQERGFGKKKAQKVTKHPKYLNEGME